ncbi:methyltransferase-like protein 27 [Watersipora subatra]|uniref:methyltransferase-like protein 27 n=1 Tax=Watersipora subatra TaxID=2589382 RepID=UPI00355BE73F
MAEFTAAPETVGASSDWSGNVLAPLSEKELENQKFTSTDRIQFYSDHAKNYDQDMAKYSFTGPDVAADALHQVLNGEYDAKILDVGCGTGRVAELLLKLGPYSNIDGLEAAEGMLEVARQKGLYKNTMCQYLCLGSGLEQGTYDAIVSSGTFVAGHMKSDCLIELCNATKSGGYIVVTMRHEHLETVDEYKQNMRPTINQLTSENKWKVVKDQRFPNWCYGKDGQGIDGHLFVFHKD